MSTTNGAIVSVESLSEYDVLEIGFDGTEVYDRPPNLSENFCRVVNKIDFNEEVLSDEPNQHESNSPAAANGVTTDGKRSTSEPNHLTDDEHEHKTAGKKRGPGAPGWSWEKVHGLVRASLTEVCALIDVMSIIRDRERRYLSLEHIAFDQSEARPAGPFVTGKKKALGVASEILLKAHERLRRSQQEMMTSRQQSGTADFYTELIALRRHWRLRRGASTIIGDLSYRSAGSVFPESGQFEVRKRPTPPLSGNNPTLPGMLNAGRSPGGSMSRGGPISSSLEIVLPASLQADVQLQVELQYQEHPESGDSEWQSLYTGSGLNSAAFSTSEASKQKVTAADWHEKLKRAQCVLFFREIFAHLCFEAAQLSGQVPIITTDDQIIATIFPGVQVIISMISNRADMKDITPKVSRKRLHNGITATGIANVNSSSESQHPQSLPGKPQNRLLLNHLEIGLQSLLRSLHTYNISQSATAPRPVTGVLQMPEERRTAGRDGLSREYLQSQFAARQQPLLPAFLDMCRHAYLRHKVAMYLSKLVSEVKDPQINVHWNVCNSPVRSAVKLALITSGYENHHGRLELVVETETVRVYLRDSRIFRFGYDMRELENFLSYQIVHSHVYTMQALSQKPLAWPCLSTSVHTGLGPADRIGGNPAIILLASPDFKYGVCIRGGPSSGVQIFIRKFEQPVEASELESKASDPTWLPTAEGFREVDLERVVGGSIIAKLESILGCLTPV